MNGFRGAPREGELEPSATLLQRPYRLLVHLRGCPP